jgi:antitoxin VapB
MTYAKVFQSGNSQAVRIPKKFHINSDRVEIIKKNDVLILREKPLSLKKAFQLMTEMPEDCFDTKRIDGKPQKRVF